MKATDSPGHRRRFVVRVAVIAVLLLLLGTLVIAWPGIQRFTTGAPPVQFHRELDQDLLADYPPVVGIAHNAGNRLPTVDLALEHGADVIEVDVISVRGELVGGRDQPWAWLSNHLFRGPTLQQVWDRSASADGLKLDLKQDDRSYLDQIVDFLSARQQERQVLISTRDEKALLYLHERLPQVTMLYSTAFPDAVAHLRSDQTLQRAIGGVSAFQGLVTADYVTWLHQHHLLCFAWTVNDAERLNQLVRLHVDGITSQNLAVLNAVSGS